jgi:hypothetical protein
MIGVRPFDKEDIPAVIALRRRCTLPSEQSDEVGLASYLGELFFGNPWYDETLRSLVVTDRRDGVVGFLGVVPRRMRVEGRPVQVATTMHLTVAPDASPLVGVQLLRALFDGPQALSLADVASPSARRLWERLGGMTLASSSLAWIRLLRPVRHLLASVAHGGILARAGRLVDPPLDALSTRLLPICRQPAAPAHGRRRPLSQSELLDGLTEDPEGRGVRGDYDAASVTWLLDMMARKRRFGPLHMVKVVEPGVGCLGWYLMYIEPGGQARVAHLGARPGARGLVLDHLFHDAWLAGCAAVSGRFDACLVDSLVERRCLVYGPGVWVLVHSRDRKLLETVVRDQAALTRLDAEWWTAF